MCCAILSPWNPARSHHVEVSVGVVVVAVLLNHSMPATTKKSRKCVFPKYATCPHPMMVPSTPYAVAAKPRDTASGAAKAFKQAATSGSSLNTPKFARNTPAEASPHPSRTAVVTNAFRNRIAPPMFPFASSLGNNALHAVKIGSVKKLNSQ